MGKGVQVEHGVLHNVANITTGRDLMAATALLVEGKNEKELYADLSSIHAHVKVQLIVGAVPALQVVFDTMLNEENNAQTRLMAALAVLDRAGHSTKMLHENEGMRNVTQNMNEMSNEDITKALQSIQDKLNQIDVKKV